MSTDGKKIDFETFSREIGQVLQEMDSAPRIAGIVITEQILPGMRKEDHAGEIWVLINKETWGKMLSLFEKAESDSVVAIAGIPIFEDEDLARRILQDWKIIPGSTWRIYHG